VTLLASPVDQKLAFLSLAIHLDLYTWIRLHPTVCAQQLTLSQSTARGISACKALRALPSVIRLNLIHKDKHRSTPVVYQLAPPSYRNLSLRTDTWIPFGAPELSAFATDNTQPDPRRQSPLDQSQSIVLSVKMGEHYNGVKDKGKGSTKKISEERARHQRPGRQPCQE
jgi:hypothetical protein